MVEVQTTQQRDMREAIDAHDRRMAELKAQGETSFPKLEEKYKAFKEQIKDRYETGWNAMADRWRDGMARAAAELDAINREVDGYCPAWDDPAWSSARCRGSCRR